MRALLFAVLCLAGAASAQYPSRPVKIVVTIPPGGAPDIAARVVGRLLAAKLSESLGEQMVVDNRSGASGVIGTQVVMSSPPDGYTLLINTIPFVTNQFLMPRAPYDPLRDFVSISLVASSPSHAEFTHPQDAHRPRAGEVLRGAGADGNREHARGGRRALGKRTEEVGARHQGAGHQGGVNA